MVIGCLCFRGVVKWTDGKLYTGTFKNGLEDGSVFDLFYRLFLQTFVNWNYLFMQCWRICCTKQKSEQLWSLPRTVERWQDARLWDVQVCVCVHVCITNNNAQTWVVSLLSVVTSRFIHWFYIAGTPQVKYTRACFRITCVTVTGCCVAGSWTPPPRVSLSANGSTTKNLAMEYLMTSPGM